MEAGSETVEKVKYDLRAPQGDIGDVWINDTQYFGNVPEVAWNFYIGGYTNQHKNG